MVKFERKCCKKFMKMHSHVSAFMLEMMVIFSLMFQIIFILHKVVAYSSFFLGVLLLIVRSFVLELQLFESVNTNLEHPVFRMPE